MSGRRTISGNFRPGSCGLRHNFNETKSILGTVLLCIILTQIGSVNVYDFQTTKNIFYFDSLNDTLGNAFSDGQANDACSMAAISLVCVAMIILAIFQFKKIVESWLTLWSVMISFVTVGTLFQDGAERRPIDEHTQLAIAGSITAIYGGGAVLAFFSNQLPSFCRRFYVITNCSCIATFYLTCLPVHTTWLLLTAVVVWDIFAVLAPIRLLKISLGRLQDYGADILHFMMFTTDSCEASDCSDVEESFSRMVGGADEVTDDDSQTESGASGDDNSDSGSEPSAIHFLLLSSSRILKINLNFDRQKWSLGPVDRVDILDGLSFVYHSIDGYSKETQFVMRIGDYTCEMVNDSTNYLRVRIGALLSTVIGENCVTCQCQSRFGTEESIDVSIDLNEFGSERRIEVVCLRTTEVREAMRSFLSNVGNQGLAMENTVNEETFNVVTFPSPEILSLHSAYFKQIYYGGFMESQADIIHCEGITLTTLQNAMTYACGMDIDSRFIPELLIFFDRFCFVHALNRLKRKAEEEVIHREYGFDVEIALKIIEALQDDSVLDKFANQFVTVGCLNQAIVECFDILSKETVWRLNHRMATIHRALDRRPEIRLDCQLPDPSDHSVNMDIVLYISLFHEVRPRTVDHLIARIQSDGLHLFNNDEVDYEDWDDYTILPPLASPLEINEDEQQSLALLSDPICLFYDRSTCELRLGIYGDLAIGQLENVMRMEKYLALIEKVSAISMK